jgi:two-component system response regulator PilR (NtrC family)
MSRRPERRTTPRSAQVLVVDDEPDIRELLELTLTKMGLGVDAVGTIADARERLKAGKYDLCLTDMRLGDGEGLELVRHIAALAADLPVAVITAYGSAENAVAALKAGAFDYVSKPVGLEQLRALIKSALSLPERADSTGRDLLGASAPLAHVRGLIGKLARTQAPRDKPFVPVNCGAIPETLVESELFGYRKGAFTGANEDREGVFQAAHGGTLFLDEIAELPLHTQVQLLRAIQERRVRKVGSTQEEPVDVRIICATNQSLAGMVEAGRFRRDLYYRLNVVELTMPPLRECREDIPTIAAHILQRLAAQNDVPPAQLSAPALEELMAYDFPGNVRELENILERALALSPGGELGSADLALHRIAPEEEPEEREAQPAVKPLDTPLPAYLDQLERDAILQALGKTGFNRTAAARLLGITFRQLRYRMQRLNIKDENR